MGRPTPAQPGLEPQGRAPANLGTAPPRHGWAAEQAGCAMRFHPYMQVSIFVIFSFLAKPYIQVLKSGLYPDPHKQAQPKFNFWSDSHLSQILARPKLHPSPISLLHYCSPNHSSLKRRQAMFLLLFSVRSKIPKLRVNLNSKHLNHAGILHLQKVSQIHRQCCRIQIQSALCSRAPTFPNSFHFLD